jgi:hypothetical protein
MTRRTLDEELNELRNNPTARALLSNFDTLDDERSELLMTRLADIGEGFNDGYS